MEPRNAPTDTARQDGRGAPTAARTAVGRRNVPAAVFDRSSIPDADYADWFSVAAPGSASPEQCARAMFGDAPGWKAKLIWGQLLRLRLIRTPCANSIAGYRIAARGTCWIRLEASSGSLASNLIVATDDDGISLATLMRYDRRPGRAMWSLLSAVHRAAAPGLLARTAAALSSSTPDEHIRRRSSEGPDDDL